MSAGERTAFCPTCRAKVVQHQAQPSKLFPFCSQRCHLVDLGRWLGEEYRIPGPPSSEAAEAALAIGDRPTDED
ncbi:MAG: DNA gyrase inhibitor YacG [Kofleriaceae bacterium]